MGAIQQGQSAAHGQQSLSISKQARALMRSACCMRPATNKQVM